MVPQGLGRRGHSGALPHTTAPSVLLLSCSPSQPGPAGPAQRTQQPAEAETGWEAAWVPQALSCARSRIEISARSGRLCRGPQGAPGVQRPCARLVADGQAVRVVAQGQHHGGRLPPHAAVAAPGVACAGRAGRGRKPAHCTLTGQCGPRLSLFFTTCWPDMHVPCIWSWPLCSATADRAS